jgi:hypothetical protein
MSPSYFLAFLNIYTICLAMVSVAFIPSVRMMVQLDWRVAPLALQRPQRLPPFGVVALKLFSPNMRL